MQENEIPRRIDLRRSTPAELAIRAAVEEVEKAGAHPLLTEAVILLGQAREKVADYVDLPCVICNKVHPGIPYCDVQDVKSGGE